MTTLIDLASPQEVASRHARMQAAQQAPNRISGGASMSTPSCPTCPHLKQDTKHPGWGWCEHPQNRVFSDGWPNGFTPSQSPSGTCDLHPKRIAINQFAQENRNV